jgi:plasmid stabilization system protein ParE
MSLRILFRPIADKELDDAMAWYESKKAGLGAELKEAVDHALKRIAENPGRFRRVRGEVRRALLRRFPYAIHFLPEPQAIVVLAVFHTRRDPQHLEGRA